MILRFTCVFHFISTNYNNFYNLQYQYIVGNKLQPACMIGNNHDMFYIPGEDYAIYALYGPFPQADYDKDPRLKGMPLSDGYEYE